jgi:hypothetical protein
MNLQSGARRRHLKANPLHCTIPTILILSLISLGSFSCSSFTQGNLLTWQEYTEHPRIGPYILELDKKPGRLFYYGAFHKVDPKDPQFEDIEQKWEQFRPTCAFCEGRIWPLEESRAQAIQSYGEQGLITFLAARDGIPVKCIDASISEQIRYLRNRYPPHQVKIFFILRQASINKMLRRKEKNLDDACLLLSKMERFGGSRYFPATLVEFEHMVSQLFPELDNWQNIPYAYFQSKEIGGFLADIHKELLEYRDQTMVKKVTKALKKGERVFAVVGRSHVFKQQDILRSLTW